MKKFIFGTLISTMLISTNVFASTVAIETTAIAAPTAQPISYVSPQYYKTSETATIKVAPDTAKLMLSVSANGKTAAESKAQVDKAISTLKSGLKNYVSANDISVVSIYSYPAYKYDPETYESTQVGYNTEARVEVTIKDLDQLSNILDKTFDTELVTVSNLSFESSKYDDYYNQALVKAINTAEKRAKYLAENVYDSKNVKIESISSNNFSGPVYYESSKSVAVNDSSATVDYIPQTIDISATAEVGFSIY